MAARGQFTSDKFTGILRRHRITRTMHAKIVPPRSAAPCDRASTMPSSAARALAPS